MRIAIVGSREFKNLQLVKDFVNLLPKSAVVVSGGAQGVDKTAEDFAKVCKLPQPKIFLPEYDKYPGKVAPKIRNSQIAAYCDVMVCFWNGLSTGSQDAVNKARRLGKPVRILLETATAQDLQSTLHAFGLKRS